MMTKRSQGSFSKLPMAYQLVEQLQSKPDIGSLLAEEKFETVEPTPEQENTGNAFS